MTIREEKEIREIQTGNEVNLSPFADKVILYIENPKDPIGNLLELIKEFSKVTGYKINTWKSLAYLYGNNERSENKIKEIIPFTAATERIKYLGINLPKERTSLVAQMVKRLFKMWEAQVRALGWEDPLEKKMAIHSSTIAWKIPWTEEPGRLQSMGSQRVGHD